MVASRDLQCGNDVAKMAALGRYADEFIIYAVSFWQDGRIYHQVSSSQEEIWRFVEDCQRQDVYPTLVDKWVNRTLVPSGEREHYLLRSKISMAQRMKAAYPPAFLTTLAQFAARENTNAASALLLQWQDELIGCFDREMLERFATLVQYAYTAKKLSRSDYDHFQGWLAHINRQMEDDVVVKKNFERTFYGFIYEARGQKQCFVNAKKALVWQKRQELLSSGVRTTPIWQKTYRYDFQPNLMETKQQFLAYLKASFDENYCQRLAAIDQLPSAIGSQDFDQWQSTLMEAGLQQLKTAVYYKTLWGL